MRKIWKGMVRQAWVRLEEALLGFCLSEMGMSLQEAKQFLAVVFGRRESGHHS